LPIAIDLFDAHVKFNSRLLTVNIREREREKGEKKTRCVLKSDVEGFVRSIQRKTHCYEAEKEMRRRTMVATCCWKE